MNFEYVMKRVMGLAALKFFPTETDAHLAIVEAVGSMAKSHEQVDWLVKRMLVLYNQWPGTREMRAVFCARFKPGDGIEVRGSEVYPDGIPSERKEQAPVLALPEGVKPGDVPSVDPAELQDMIRRLAERKSMDRPRRLLAPISANNPLITQADVDREIEKIRDAKARGELGWES